MYDKLYLKGEKEKENLIIRLDGYGLKLEDIVKDVVFGHPPFIKYTKGDGCIISDQAWLDNTAEIKVGDEVLIAAEVNIYRHDHGEQFLPYIPLVHENIYFTNSLEIGDNVFIGKRCFILPQCKKIGNNVTIGAGSVVTKDIPNNQICAGYPAKQIKSKHVLLR